MDNNVISAAEGVTLVVLQTENVIFVFSLIYLAGETNSKSNQVLLIPCPYNRTALSVILPLTITIVIQFVLACAPLL